MAKRSSSRGSGPKRQPDGTRYIFWLNMLMIFVFIILLVLGQWDFLLAGVLLFFVLNGVLGRR